MAKESNPYSSPLAEANVAPASDRLVIDFAKLIKRWEPLRIVYNFLLVAFVLAVTVLLYPRLAYRIAYWELIVVGGIVANMCFFVGPAVEGYLAFFGFRNRHLTKLFFVIGLSFTALLAMMSIHSCGEFLQ